METKSCQNCEMGKVAYPNNTCQVCTSTDLSMWQPNEQTKKEYMIKLAECGSNGTTEYDVVSKPKHYMLFEEEGIEVRDVIKKLVSKLSLDNDAGMFVSDYVQLMQYLMRFMDKNGVEDLKKARWYLDKMIEAY
mgnify:CR=1 FL=1